MGMIQEFKTFISRGNVIDLAVGVIIGAAFGKIVSSLVDNILMPLLGIILGKINFSTLAYSVRDLDGKTIAEIKYGLFLQNTFDFVIVAAAIFLMVKVINKLKKPADEAPAPAPAAPPEDILLLREIRDTLKRR
ncbi:MAG: large-conductance mechanosensitive channel protein MscL [Verrucomicrobiae bacterium]|nr:large-conductance mechanosensitive channel protein MscL [Verrucomicrobiae bacterium]